MFIYNTCYLSYKAFKKSNKMQRLSIHFVYKCMLHRVSSCTVCYSAGVLQTSKQMLPQHSGYSVYIHGFFDTPLYFIAKLCRWVCNGLSNVSSY